MCDLHVPCHSHLITTRPILEPIQKQFSLLISISKFSLYPFVVHGKACKIVLTVWMINGPWRIYSRIASAPVVKSAIWIPRVMIMQHTSIVRFTMYCKIHCKCVILGQGRITMIYMFEIKFVSIISLMYQTFLLL